MSAIGGLLALLVVFYLEDVQIEYHAPADHRPATVDVFDQTRLDRPTNRTPADPNVIIKAIRRVREGDLDRARHRDELPPLDLPGFGPLGADDCGDDLPHFCRSCGATFSIGRTCKLSTCPRCVKSWARERASSICAKLDALRRYKYASGIDN